jgi:hypothetical protein
MKINVKLFIFVAIITISQISTKSSHKRKSHRNHSKKIKTSGDEGSGTWQTKFVCGKIEVQKDQTDEITYTNVSFRAQQLEKPNNIYEKTGLVLTFSAPLTGHLTEILIPYPGVTNTYILPFTLFSFSKFQLKDFGGFWSGEHKGIFAETFVKIFGDNYYKYDRYSIKISLPYARGEQFKFITYDNMLKLIKLLTDRKNEYNRLVLETVRAAQEAAAEYESNSKMLLELSTLNVETLKQHMKASEASLLSKIEEDRKQLKELEEKKTHLDAERLKVNDKRQDFEVMVKEQQDDLLFYRELIKLNTEKAKGLKISEEAIKRAKEDVKIEIEGSLKSMFDLTALPSDKITMFKNQVGSDYSAAKFREELLKLPF